MANMKRHCEKNGKHISKCPKRKIPVCKKAYTLEMDVSFSQATNTAATQGLLLMAVLPTKHVIFDKVMSNSRSLSTKISYNFLIWKPNKETLEKSLLMTEQIKEPVESCQLFSLVIDPSSKKTLVKFSLSQESTFESQLTQFLKQNKSTSIDFDESTCKKRKLNEDSLNFDKISQSLETIMKTPLKRKITMKYQELCASETKRPKYENIKNHSLFYKDGYSSTSKSEICFSQQKQTTEIKHPTKEDKTSLFELTEKEKQKRYETGCCNCIMFSVMSHNSGKPRYMWKFSPDDTVESILNRMEQDGFSRQHFDLMAHFPMRNISRMYHKCKLSSIFSKNELLFIKEKQDEDSD